MFCSAEACVDVLADFLAVMYRENNSHQSMGDALHVLANETMLKLQAVQDEAASFQSVAAARQAVGSGFLTGSGTACGSPAACKLKSS